MGCFYFFCFLTLILILFLPCPSLSSPQLSLLTGVRLWARPAILVAGKGRGGMFYFSFFFTFIPVPLSSLSLSFISFTISSISFLPFSGRRHKMTHKGSRVVKLQHNQSITWKQHLAPIQDKTPMLLNKRMPRLCNFLLHRKLYSFSS